VLGNKNGQNPEIYTNLKNRPDGNFSVKKRTCPWKRGRFVTIVSVLSVIISLWYFVLWCFI